MRPSSLDYVKVAGDRLRKLTKPEEAGRREEYYVLNLQVVRKVVQFLSFLLFIGVVFGLGPFPIVLPVMFTLGLQTQAMGDAFAMMQVMLGEAVFPWIPFRSTV